LKFLTASAERRQQQLTAHWTLSDATVGVTDGDFCISGNSY